MNSTGAEGPAAGLVTVIATVPAVVRKLAGSTAVWPVVTSAVALAETTAPATGALDRVTVRVTSGLPTLADCGLIDAMLAVPCLAIRPMTEGPRPTKYTALESSASALAARVVRVVRPPPDFDRWWIPLESET
ncbi:MAG: hypothetical protein H6Q89_409 [Myxococcaceae bacterium]|nr:hypothetical protein [Myxococcaceae bacterium]